MLNQIETMIYFLVLLMETIYCIVKRKNILGCLLLILYTGVAFFCVLCVHQSLLSQFLNGINALPYLFLLLVYFICFYPFLTGSTPDAENISYKDTDFELNNWYLKFIVFYIICTIVKIITYLPATLQIARLGNWAANRRSLYSGEMIFPDSSPIVHILCQFSSYLQLLALINAFVIIQRNKKKSLGIITILLCISDTIITAIYSSSRGTLVIFVFELLALIMFFYKALQKGSKALIVILLIAGIAIIIPFLIAVTVDRFSGTTNASSSVIEYLGTGPIAFNAGVFDIKQYLFGGFGYGRLFGFYPDFNPSMIGGTWGTAFYTFVGWLYIDWGPIGTLIISLILAVFWDLYNKRKTWHISDIFLIFSYYNFLLNGVFVVGRNYCYTFLANLIIYFLMHFLFEKYQITFAGKRI
jgi:oligosaccharide repeat unit polymerase